MHLNIQGLHLEITPAIHAHVKEKIKKIKYYFDYIIHANVVLSVIKNEHYAEATITVEHHHFHNKIKSDDLYKSIDILFDKLERQVRRHKEYLIDKTRKSKSKHHHLLELQGVKGGEQYNIDEREISDKPMDELEAVLQLDVDKKAEFLGIYENDKVNIPKFVEKTNDKNFSIYYYDGHWERKDVELADKNKLQINTIESIRLVTETIEDALAYLETHPHEKSRLFRSVRTGTVMMAFHKVNGIFGLIHERLAS